MSWDFQATIGKDGIVTWHGMSTGKTEVVARNEKQGLIAFLIGGHTYWDGVGHRAYANAKFVVCKFESIHSDGKGDVIQVDYFGKQLEWNTRRPW